jgi:mannose-6-phosphate isomerase-like protein (cupin superfamily)
LFAASPTAIVVDMNTDTTTNAPLLVRASEAETLTGDPGGTIALLADSATTGGAITCNRSTFRAGADGAPPHFHTRASELFVVLSGSLQVLVGDRVDVLGQGDALLVPPRVPHAFGAVAGADADVLFVFTPGMDRFDYYRLLDRVHRGEADPREIGESQERFDNHYVDSPLWRETRS